MDPFAGLPGCWQPGRWSTPAHDKITVTDPDTGMHLFLSLDMRRQHIEPPDIPVHVWPVYPWRDPWRDRHQPLTVIDPPDIP